jgi:outer membrane protein assembly factor BamB
MTTDISVPQSPPAASRWRLWFPVLLIVLYWGAVYATTFLDFGARERFMTRALGFLLWMVLFSIWWMVHRHQSFAQRALALAVAVGAAVLTNVFAHKSFLVIAVMLTGVPIVLTVWTAWLFVSWNMSRQARLVGVLCFIVAAWIPLLFLRMDGLTGDTAAVLHWRWEPSAEELFLAQHARQPVPAAATAAVKVVETPGDWPGFRGPDRDGIVHGTHISTDWSAHPPKQLFRQRAGAGWSSICVIGSRLFTQEQRGDAEAVVCLDANTGQELWVHSDSTRFWDGQSGAGPRGTPSFANGRIYAFGATGKLNCLDAATGAVVWSHDTAADSGAPAPMWGFSASPLVVGNRVIVFTGARREEEGRALLAYGCEKGELAWSVAAGHQSYGSAQAVTLNGVPQVLSFSDEGLISVDPATGKTLWKRDDKELMVWRAIQPHVLGDSKVLITTETNNGTVLLNTTHSGGAWTTKDAWRSRNLKASFNDCAVFDGNIYGFDSGIFCCVDATTGERRWKDGHYGHGQMLLLADQALIVVLTEQGEAVLVAAKPDKFSELGRAQVLDGKTWNHPALAHDRLYVRNAEEIAGYELSEEKK